MPDTKETRKAVDRANIKLAEAKRKGEGESEARAQLKAAIAAYDAK